LRDALSSCAFSLALEKAGSSIAARITMIPVTTKSSINVNPHPGFLQLENKIADKLSIIIIKRYYEGISSGGKGLFFSGWGLFLVNR
jgi:hypothetical protein